MSDQDEGAEPSPIEWMRTLPWKEGIMAEGDDGELHIIAEWVNPMSEGAEPVKPALTADEWDLLVNDYGDDGPRLPGFVWDYSVELALRDRTTTTKERAHASAAMHLYGQPFGFTWQDVEMIRTIANVVLNRPISEPYAFPHLVEDFYDLADRIAALLPPREP